METLARGEKNMQIKNKTVGSTWSVEKVVFGGVEECNVVMNLKSEKIIGWGLKKKGIGELLNGLLEKLGSVSKLYLELIVFVKVTLQLYGKIQMILNLCVR